MTKVALITMIFIATRTLAQEENEETEEVPEAENILEIPPLTSAQEYEYRNCRECLDSYTNSYFCLGIEQKGYCCDFLESSIGISKFEPLQCSHSPTLGQTCSHRVDAGLLGGTDPTRLALQQKKSNKDYFICETDLYGCEYDTLELEVDGSSNTMVWDLSALQPMNGFCNWKIKVKGIDLLTSKLSNPELSQYVVNISIESVKSDFNLVSATEKEFDFGESGDKDSKSYNQLTLERAALLDIHVIASQPATLLRSNFDIKITAEIKDLTAMSVGGIVTILVTILVVSLVIFGLLLQAMGKVDFVKRCRPKPMTEIEL